MSSYTVRIYKIVNNIDDKCYIGSTKQRLNLRFNEHKCHSKNNSTVSHILFRDYGNSNCSIVLLEEIEVGSRQEQLMLERDYIERNIENCVNTRIPIRSNEETKERVKAWNNSHKEYQKARWAQQGEKYNSIRRERRKAMKKEKPESL